MTYDEAIGLAWHVFKRDHSDAPELVLNGLTFGCKISRKTDDYIEVYFALTMKKDRRTRAVFRAQVFKDTGEVRVTHLEDLRKIDVNDIELGQDPNILCR